MEQNVIGLGFNVGEFTAEQKIVIALLKEVYENAVKISTLPIPINVEPSIASLNKATKEFNTTVQSAVTGVNQVAVASTNMAAASAQATQATSASTKSLEQNIQQQIRLKNTQESLKQDQKENLALLKAGTISQEEYKQRLVETVGQQVKYKQQIKEINKEIEAQQKLNSVPQNTIASARAENAILIPKRDLTPEGTQLDAINAKIDKNNDLIDKNNDKLGKQKINIGNYSQSFKSALTVLEDELIKVNAQIAKTGPTEELTKKSITLTQATTSLGTAITNTSGQSGAFKKVATELGAVYGTNSTVFKAFNKEVGSGVKEIRSITDEVKKAAGEGAKTGNIFQKAFSGLRTLANVIPGIGISGLLLLAVGPLIDLVQQLDIFKGKADKAKLAQDDLNGAINKSGGEYQKAVADVERLTIEVDLAKQGFLNKDGVLKDYNDTLGKTTGQVKTLDEAEQQLVKNGDAYIRMMLYKAAANLALEEAAKKSYEAELTRQKADKEFENKFLDAGLSGGLASGANAEQLVKSNAENAKRNQERRKKEQLDAAISAQNKQLDIAKDFLKKAGTIANEFNFDMFGTGDSAKTKKKLSELIDSTFEIYKIGQERKIRLLAEDIAEETTNYDEKIELLKKYSSARLQLLERQKREEIRKVNSDLGNDVSNLNLEKKPGADIDGINAEIVRKQANASEKIRLIKAKYNDLDFQETHDLKNKEEKATEDFDKRRLEAVKRVFDNEKSLDATKNEEISKSDANSFLERTEAYAQYYKDQQDIIIADHNFQLETKKLTGEELLALDADTNKKLHELAIKAKKDISDISVSSVKSMDALFDDSVKAKLTDDEIALFNSLKNKKNGIKKYNEDVLKIEREAQNKILQNGIDTDIKLLNDEKITADEKVKIQHDLNEKIDAQKKLGFDADKQAADKAATEKQQYRDLEIQSVQYFFDLAQKLADNYYEKRFANIQKERDMLQASSDQELKNIQNSTISEQEKAAQTTLLNARVAQQKAELDRKEREEKIKQAKLNKAINIAEIIIQTALAVTKALPVIPLAIAAGIAGAAELALAIATPIPTYAEGVGIDGKGEHAGGPAIVGERKDGIPEYVQPGDGSSPFIARTATLLKNLSARSKVIPMTAQNMNDYLFNKSMSKVVEMPVNVGIDADKIVNGINNELQQVTKAVKKIKAPIVNIYSDSAWQEHKRKSI